MNDVAIVIPTIGRDSLRATLTSIAVSEGSAPHEIIIVDDRRTSHDPVDVAQWLPSHCRVVVLQSCGRGPAAARNAGWRAARAPWICFVDDDVVVSATWLTDLHDDLSRASEHVAGVQGRIIVPLPLDRRATDWERNVANLARSAWITADMAYRREALEAVGGFDERFRRAYREDSDLAIRIERRGWTLAVGTRVALHPVRAADAWVSVRLQAGNADDVLMRALHGPQWRALAHAPAGRFRAHTVTVACAMTAIVGALAGTKHLAVLAGVAWLFATAQFAWSRFVTGPRTLREFAAMSATSAAIPFAAVYHKARGFAQLPSKLRSSAA